MFSNLSQQHTSWSRSQATTAPVLPSILRKQGTCDEQVMGYRFNDINSTGFEECKALM